MVLCAPNMKAREEEFLKPNFISEYYAWNCRLTMPCLILSLKYGFIDET